MPIPRLAHLLFLLLLPSLFAACDPADEVVAPADDGSDGTIPHAKPEPKVPLPPVDTSLTLEQVRSEGEVHNGKRVAWQGNLASMDREAGAIHFTFLANEGTPANASDMQIFAVDCQEGEVDEKQLFEIGTSSKPIVVTGVVQGVADVKISVDDGTSNKGAVPRLISPQFEIAE